MKRLFLFISIISTKFISAQNTIVLNADKGKDIINKNIYGHFAEHLGHCIYGGFYVGDSNKTIPHKDGVRLDVIEALKKLKVPVYKFLKEPIVRKYGEDFYNALEIAATEFKSDKRK